MVKQAHPFTQLATQSVAHYLEHGDQMGCPGDLEKEFQRKAGAFVTLRRGKQLRGCIGSLTPQTENLAKEIIRNSVQAAFHDPRFTPVTRKELEDLDFSVEVVSPPEKVSSTSELDPKTFGLVVRSQNKQGVLLPGIEGVETIEDQIRICRLKGRIKEKDPQEFLRFRVESYH